MSVEDLSVEITAANDRLQEAPFQYGLEELQAIHPAEYIDALRTVLSGLRETVRHSSTARHHINKARNEAYTVHQELSATGAASSESPFLQAMSEHVGSLDVSSRDAMIQTSAVNRAGYSAISYVVSALKALEETLQPALGNAIQATESSVAHREQTIAEGEAYTQKITGTPS